MFIENYLIGKLIIDNFQIFMDSELDQIRYEN